MKKVLLILLAVIGFGISVNAQDARKVAFFRSAQILCCENDFVEERIYLDKDCTFKFYKASILVASGFYDYDSSDKTITLKGIDARGKPYELLLTKVSASSTKISKAYFNKVLYEPCE
jgi:hypothetical protein